MEHEALEQLSFGIDLLNLAAHLSDEVPNEDFDKLQDAVRVMRVVACPPKYQ